MTTYDIVETRSFLADLESRLTRCDNGEGYECANMEGMLRHYASLCCEFRESVRQWGQAVFSGRAAFDPDVEQMWLNEGMRLFSRAVEMWECGKSAEETCYVLEGQAALRSALWVLDRLLKNWVTPKLAVGPSARQLIDPQGSGVREAQLRIDSLSPLPSDWKPSDFRRANFFDKTRRSHPD